jgi:probable HAF family extracellular repeat protein
VVERLEDRSCPSGYAFTVLNPISGDTATTADAVNDSGQAVGNSYVYSSTLPGHAVLWPSGSGDPNDLGTLGGAGAGASDINASGQVVDDADTASGGDHAFLWNPTTANSLTGMMIDLGTSPGFSINGAAGINNAGQVVGTEQDASGVKHAFLVMPVDTNADGKPDVWYQDSNHDGFNDLMRDLGTLGSSFSTADDINASGQVVGYSNTAAGTPPDAFRWQNGVMTILGPKSALFATATNDSGQVVGTVAARYFQEHAGLWQGNGGWKDLGTIGGVVGYSNASDINASGQVVGYSEFSGGTSGVHHAFLWQSKPGMVDLNTLVSTGFDLQDAIGINTGGQIAALGYGGGTVRGLLLTPTTTASSSLSAAATGTTTTTAAPTVIAPLDTTTTGPEIILPMPQGPVDLMTTPRNRASRPSLA